MTALQFDCLRMLRVFGPCSNSEVFRRLRANGYQGTAAKTYRAIQTLTAAGYAQHTKLQAWDLSDLGKEAFSQMPHHPPRLYGEEP